jgi:hypothetical protein
MALTRAIGFDKVRPLNTEDVGRGTIGRARGARDRGNDGSGGAMGVELRIKGGIPLRPVRQALKVAAGETFKATLLVGHTLGLQTVYHIRHLSRRKIRCEIVEQGGILMG